MTVRFKARGSIGEIWLYDQIGESFWGDGISAKSFQKDLAGLGRVTNIDLRINSPGGDVFDGFAIYNLIAQHPANVTVYVDGVAASIASIIAMAGNSILMAKNSLMMIHNPQGVAVGDEDEMDRVKSLLRQVKANLIAAYAERTGNSAEKIGEWMNDETWFHAENAVELGFADSVIEAQAVSSGFDLKHFRNVPAALRDMAANQRATPELDMRRHKVDDLSKRAFIANSRA